MRLALAALFISFIVAGTAAAEDLMRVYQDAIDNDPQIREADATRKANREVRPQALGALLPQANGSAEYTRSKSDGSQPTTISDPLTGIVTILPIAQNTTTDTHGYTLSLRQNLFSWQNWMELRRANRSVAQAEADYQAAEQSLVQRVAQAYFDVLAAQNLVESQSAAFEAIGRQFDQANKRFEVGLIAITDVQEAKAARDSAAAAVIDAKRQVATAKQSLRAITGKEYGTLTNPSEGMPLVSPSPADAEQWVELSMNQNAALISSRLASDIARQDVGIARGGHFPVLDAVGSRTKTNNNIDFSTAGFGGRFSTDGTVDTYGLQISVPIFAGGATQSRVRQAEYQWIAAKERTARVTRDTERLARDAYLGVMSEMARVGALKQALESSQTALKATQAGYDVGTRTAVDVLLAQQNLVSAQTNYARSKYDYLLNVITLRLAAGNLDGNTVQEVNQWISTPTPAGQAVPAGQSEPAGEAPPADQAPQR